MIINSQRTIYGLSLQMALLLKEPYIVLPNTTLNEKFDILKSDTLGVDEYPGLNYYTIGVGGGNIVSDVNTYNFSKHKPTDAALFEHIPFVIKTANNDLSITERAKYRFRILQLINGIEYICYYLKVITNRTVKDGFYEVNVSNGIPKLSLFDTNTDKLLNPVPRDPGAGIIDTTNTNYIAKVTKLQFSLFNAELLEIDNVIEILYGAGVNKNITEIGVCFGIDRPAVDENGVAYQEVSTTQVSYHFEVDINTAIAIQNDGDFIRSVEISGMEPLVL